MRTPAVNLEQPGWPPSRPELRQGGPPDLPRREPSTRASAAKAPPVSSVWTRRYTSAGTLPLARGLAPPQLPEPPETPANEDPFYTVTYDRLGGKRLRFTPLGPGLAPGLAPEFDPSYGYSLADLLRVQPPQAPADFGAFWAPRYAEALALPPKASFRPLKRIGNFDIYVAHYDGVGGKRLGGYLALPIHGKADNGVVSVHGYGGRDVPTAQDLARYSPTTAVLFPFVRGFGLSADPDIPSASDLHVIRGIDARETYEIGNSVSDVWSATNALLVAVPTVRGRLALEGVSFGGGIGTLALAWDHRFAKAYFEVPTFGHQELRMRLPTYGSGRAVQEYIARSGDPARILRTLSYFDAGSAARFVRTPTMIAAGLSDAAVAPPGQFAIYNALASQKELLVMSAGHAELPEDEAKSLDARRRTWLGFAA